MYMSFQFIKRNDNFKSCVVPILYDQKYQFIRGRRGGGLGARTINFLAEIKYSFNDHK